MLGTASKQPDVSSSVWVYGWSSDLDKMTWYSIDLGEHEEARKFKRRRTHNVSLRHGRRLKRKGKIIRPSIPATCGLFISTVAVLDSVVYTIGGTDPYVFPYIPDPYIRCLDTTHADAGWKQFNMQMGRLDAQVADLDGKIYIFDGNHSADDSPTAEVFDPSTGRVEKVIGYKTGWSLVGVDRDWKRIVFIAYVPETDHYTGTEVYSVIFYYPGTDKWGEESHPTLGPDIIQLSYSPARVFVGTTIYWFSGSDVKAYDFVNHKFYYSITLVDLPGYPHRWEDAYSFLFHINEDYFCIVWVESSLYHFKYKQIHCTKVRISTCTTHEMLTVDVLDTETNLIAGGFRVMDALHVVPSREFKLTPKGPTQGGADAPSALSATSSSAISSP